MESRGPRVDGTINFQCMKGAPTHQIAFEDWKTENEAIAALNAAVHSRKSGNLQKVGTIFSFR